MLSELFGSLKKHGNSFDLTETAESVRTLLYYNGVAPYKQLLQRSSLPRKSLSKPTAIIYPNIRLERGVTVEPFAVVQASLRENEVQQGPVGPRVIM